MMIRIYLLALMTLTAGLCACGGGVVAGTEVAVSPLVYGKLGSFTVTGPNLDKGITVTAAGCSGIAELPGSTDSRKTYTCTPSRVGGITVTVVGGGTVLRSINTFVPQPQITLKTSVGGVSQEDIVVELYPANAPLAVNNVLQYVIDGFYNNLIFHRVIPNYVVQGGGFTANLEQPETRAPVKLEVPNGLSNLRGTVAMARAAGLDSATSQFFINTVDNVSLDTRAGGYAVFGKVVVGMAVVDAISAVPTRTLDGVPDVPVLPVVIVSVVQSQ